MLAGGTLALISVSPLRVTLTDWQTVAGTPGTEPKPVARMLSGVSSWVRNRKVQVMSATPSPVLSTLIQ